MLATCAGLILLASHISNDDNVYFGTLPDTVKRNAYGRQLGRIPAFVNLIVIVIRSGKFFQLLKDYKARYLGIGTVDPNFRLFDEEE